MKVNELEQVCITSVGDFHAHGGVSKDTIAAVEMKTGIHLPPDYIEFLEIYGCIETGSEEIIGLGGPKHLNFVKLRQELLMSSVQAFPKSLIPIRADGFGNYDCLQISANSQPSNVVKWFHDGNGVVGNEIAPTFSTWLDAFCRLANQ